ncbi:MAG: glycosyltransferase family 4 protein [bacterium]|nr:hypothetical protein [Deltaproteobacteria bacterium]MCP4905277.1 glycosyltransferase family 4 protein [bacterium]
MTFSRRILLLNERDLEHPRAGGAEIHVARIFARLVARGHQVTQYSSGFSGGDRRTRIDGIRIERRGPLPLYYASVPGRVRAAAKRSEFDLVIECLNKVPFYTPLYSHLPILAICHHLFGEVAFDQVSFPIATAAVLSESGISRAYRDSLFLAISDSTRDDLVHRGIRPDRITVSPPGIDPASFEVDPLADRPARATYVGRLERYKRIDLLLRAGALLVDRFPDLELLVMGKGPERARLEALARSLGLEGRTRFTGFVEDRERDALLAGSRVCAFPSEKEGWGLTVIEANALGTPVVARNAPGLRDSIRHGETGLLVDPVASGADEARRYAEAMAILLDGGEEARKMRSACLEWSKHFDWDRAATEMEVAIERSLGEALSR